MNLPARLFDLLRRFWPGESRGARWFWLWHLVAALVAAGYLREAKPPSRMRWTRQVEEGLRHNLSDYIEIGLWNGAVVHLVVSVLVLLTVRWWGRAAVATLETRLAPPRAPLRGFGIGLLLILIAAAAVRLPRMTLSYWGDEGWAAKIYAHGQFKPVAGTDMQGELEFHPCSWRMALWNDHNGGNHYFFSLLQKATMDTWRALKGLPPSAFDEAISRLPPLGAGLLSIVLAALFVRWLGRPGAGLLLAALLAAHPWHIRYSTEARGYALMLCFFIALLWLLMVALRGKRWRAWGGVAVTSLLCVWSWKLAAVSVAAVCAVVLLRLLLAGGFSWSERVAAVGRLLVAFATAGAACVWLVMPAAMQSPEVTARFQHMGKPMNAAWLKNSLSGIVSGLPWQQGDPRNPTEVHVSQALEMRPVTAALGFGGILLLVAVGTVALWRQRALHAQLCLAVFAASAMGAAAFKWQVRVEWIYWYFFPLLLPAMVLATAGACAVLRLLRRPAAPWLGALPVALILVAFLALLQPFIALNLRQPYENHRRAFELTRGRHEPWTEAGPYTGPSKVFTCYLWRHVHLYDTRASTSVRDAAGLRALLERVRQVQGELYFVVGMIGFSEATSADLIAVLRDDREFEKLDTLWAQESIHILEVYRWRGGGGEARGDG